MRVHPDQCLVGRWVGVAKRGKHSHCSPKHTLWEDATRHFGLFVLENKQHEVNKIRLFFWLFVPCTRVGCGQTSNMTLTKLGVSFWLFVPESQKSMRLCENASRH